MGSGTSQLRWMVDRLRVMPLAELPHRVLEQQRRWTDRRRPFRAAAPALTGAMPGLPLARPALSAAERARLRADVDALLAEDFTLLGHRWRSRRDWGLDPGTGVRWPLDGAPDRLDLSAGDVRVGWALLRLQHLQVLALGATLLDHDGAQAALHGDLQHLLSALRPYEGIAYASGIECGLRVVSLLVIGGLVPLPAEAWPTLAAHAAWLRRYPSRYSSANNHRIAELAALYLLGLCAPDLDVGGLDDLEAELSAVARRQFHSDGVGTEQSITYQAFTTEWLALCLWAARAQQRAPAGLAALLRRSAGFLSAITDRAGDTPLIGDADESAVVRDGLASTRYPAAIAGLVSALLSDPSVRPPSWRLDLRSRLLGLPDPGPAPAPEHRSFVAGGYTVFRPPWGMLVLDHGPLGFDSTGGHGHADALSVWVHRGGQPVIVDAGTHRYHDEAPWRTWSRSTAAHNTVTVDNLDQSVMTGAFNWGRRAQARLEAVSLPDGSATASHDGYHPVTHRRTVSISDTGFDLVDRIDGDTAVAVAVAVAVRLQLAPGLSAAAAGDTIQVRRDGVLVATVRAAGGGLRPSVVLGAGAPGPGWCAQGYNAAVPAPCLEWAGEISLPIDITLSWRWAPENTTGELR